MIMNMREKFTYLLLPLGVILAILPLRETRSLQGNPGKILMNSLDQKTVLTPDQVARMVVKEDSTLVLIDLRPADEFSQFTIPGSVNVPYEELVKRDPSTYLGSGNFKNVFFSNDDLKSGYAVVIAAGLGYNNCYLMKGGMNEWFRVVMNSAFKGEKISAMENALFETRSKAKRMFSEMNSLPDSLKVKYLKSKRFDPRKLDGGCE
jgi:rhodanese-related sulfurtransferase